MAVVSVSTVGSRVLGLLRDMLLFALLGAGAVNSAFLLAFTLPNLFRRLLGEGALTAAVVPIFAEELENEGRGAAFHLLNQVLTRLFFALLGLAGAGMVFLSALRWLAEMDGRHALAAELAIVLLPYVILVCLAAILGAALNVLQRFGVVALSQVWLNLAMIISLGAGALWVAETAEGRVLLLCAGVLVGGVFQVLIPCWPLWREGWRPRVALSSEGRLSRIFVLLLPGLAGAAVVQVNIMVSRLIAFALSPEAVSILYLANRLVELPLGVFVIAVATVTFPWIARSAAQRDFAGFREAYAQSARLVLAVTIPAALGLILLGGPILRLLFEWGAFGAGDVRATGIPLAIYAAGLPFYALATLATRGLHALKDMRGPLRVACFNLVLNVVLSVTLMVPFGIAGLAFANVISSAVQWLMLDRLLRVRPERPIAPFPLLALGRMGCAGALMGLATYGGWILLVAVFGPGKLSAGLALGVLIPLAVLVYAALLWVFRFEDREALRELVTGLWRRLCG